MKQLFILLTIALLSATTAKAQNSNVAALNHEGTTTFFHGTNALQKAHEAAVHGDEIILSGGMFSTLTITKAVTIRGAGFRSDNGYILTEINGDITINIEDTTDYQLVIEGIFCREKLINKGILQGSHFEKCYFNSVFDSNTTAKVEHATFVHCYIYFLYAQSNSLIHCLNCVVDDITNNNSSSSIDFVNCTFPDFGYINYCKYCSFLNCVFNTSSSAFNSTNSAFYCVVNSDCPSFFNNNPVNENNSVDSSNYLFKEYPSVSFKHVERTSTYTYNGTKTGDDGTIVGIYGGTNPFTHVPSTRRIKSYAIDKRTDTDGGLGVNVTMK